MSKRDNVNKQQAKREIIKLREEIRFHDYRYYVLNEPVISDVEYDALMRRLQQLEEKFPDFVTPDSPTHRVGAAPREEFGTVTHSIPMLSLANALREEEVYEFDDRVKRGLDGDSPSYVAEPKIDGLAVEIVYKKGIMQVGSTRGDGVTGEDITDNLKTIKSIPLRLREEEALTPDLVEVRGEVYMGKEEFKRLNQQRQKNGESVFANPRNAAAGSVRQLNPKITANRPLGAFFYAIGRVEGREFETQWELLTTLPKWGFRVNPHIKHCANVDECVSYHHRMLEIRDQLDYDIDGTVFKVDKIAYQRRLGEISRSPRWALAYKFPSVQATTYIKDITVQVGRTGALTPVALLDPVDIEGVKVSRASLHNQDEINRKDVRMKDTVLVQRAGEVIPEVVKVIKERRTGEEEKFKLPSHCPVCGTEVTRPPGEAITRCPNINCPARLKESIKHFSSKRALDIDGLGDKIVDTLVDRGMARSIPDLYRLKKEDFLKLEGFAHKSAENMIHALERSKKTTLARLLYGLGIRYVGEHLAKVLAEHYSDINSLSRASQDELLEIPEIGPEVASSIRNFFDREQNRRVIKELRELGIQYERKQVPVRGKLKGLTFVFTGELENFTRREAQQAVEEQGARATSSVSRSTDYVVAGRNPGSKLDRARTYGVNALTEEEFIKLISE